MRASIGIPFYNSRATLSDAIRSVFSQTYKDWELLLVNDGSTDDSLEIARSINDSRVRVLDDGCNRGLVHRLNELVDESRGDYIVRMDADDIMDPDRLLRQIDYLDSNPNVDLVGSSVYTLTINNKVSGIRILSDTKITFRNVLSRCMLIHPAITGRAEWFRQHRYDSKYPRAEDHELWSRTIASSTIRVIEEPLLFYREGRSRTMRKYLMSGRSNRRIFMTYGPASIGWPNTLGLISQSIAKDCIYCFLWMSRLEELALRRSRNQIAPDQRADAELRLATARLMPVPGLDHDVGTSKRPVEHSDTR